MSTTTVNISHALTIQGWMSESELTWLAETAARVPKGGAIVEIGSYKGRSACALAANTQAMVYCVDIWSECGTDGWYYDVFSLNTERYLNIIPINRASVYAAREFAAQDMKFNCVFLDGSHDQYNVLQDIAAWQPLLKPGGVFCGHDYGFPGWPDVKMIVDKCIPKVRVVDTIWIADDQSQ